MNNREIDRIEKLEKSVQLSLAIGIGLIITIIAIIWMPVII